MGGTKVRRLESSTVFYTVLVVGLAAFVLLCAALFSTEWLHMELAGLGPGGAGGVAGSVAGTGVRKVGMGLFVWSCTSEGGVWCHPHNPLFGGDAEAQAIGAAGRAPNGTALVASASYNMYMWCGSSEASAMTWRYWLPPEGAAAGAARASCGHAWRAAVVFAVLSTLAGVAVPVRMLGAGTNNEGAVVKIGALAAVQVAAAAIALGVLLGSAAPGVERGLPAGAAVTRGYPLWLWLAAMGAHAYVLWVCYIQARDAHLFCCGGDDAMYQFGETEGVTKREETAYRRASMDAMSHAQRAKAKSKIHPGADPPMVIA